MSNFPNKQARGGDPIYWLIAVGLLFTGVAAPVGIVMIVLKLMDRKKPRGRHPYHAQQEAAAAGGTSSAQAAPPRTEQAAPRAKKARRAGGDRSPVAKMAKDGKSLTQAGIALTAVFGCICLINAVEELYILPNVLWYLEEIVPLLCFTGLGVGLWIAGARKAKKARRYRSYLSVIGSQKAVSVAALSAAAGQPARRVRDDLDDMLDDGIFPTGYLDHSSDWLVLSPDGVPDPDPQPQARQDQESAILAEIRAVNDAIDNEKLSAQIHQVGTITAKVLDFQKSHPENSAQLHSFLSYYLPTTLKLLRAYARLEDQEVSGENITAAMERIEGMMDKVVEGFEKQLDLLFQGDAMDITADVAVLERMLAKDGLADQQGITLGL